MPKLAPEGTKCQYDDCPGCQDEDIIDYGEQFYTPLFGGKEQSIRYMSSDCFEAFQERYAADEDYSSLHPDETVEEFTDHEDYTD